MSSVLVYTFLNNCAIAKEEVKRISQGYSVYLWTDSNNRMVNQSRKDIREYVQLLEKLYSKEEMMEFKNFFNRVFIFNNNNNNKMLI